MHEYTIEIPGLVESVAAVALPSLSPRAKEKHEALMAAVRGVPGLAAVAWATSREGGWLTRRGVASADGLVLSTDHAAWLTSEYLADGARALQSYERLRELQLRLTKTELTEIYLVLDRGGAQDSFVQIEIEMQQETLDCELLRRWSAPRTLQDLVDEACGDELPADERLPLGALRYVVKRVIDVAKFLSLADELEERKRERARTTLFDVRDSYTKEALGVKSLADLDPGHDKFPCKARRLFSDWEASSAGRAGARLCQHWVLKTSDWQDPSPRGLRELSIVPVWTYGKHLAEVSSRKGTGQQLLDKLQVIDRRTGVPFAWFFYLLHGNRVHDGSGHRIINAAEAGEIDLPECDYQTLRRWRAREYGF